LLLLHLLGYLFYSKKFGFKTCWIWSKNFNNLSSSLCQMCFSYPDFKNSGSLAVVLYVLKNGRPCLLFSMFRRCDRKYDQVHLYEILGFHRVSGEDHGLLGNDAVFLVICYWPFGSNCHFHLLLLWRWRQRAFSKCQQHDLIF
jgi:hypothetical protein